MSHRFALLRLTGGFGALLFAATAAVSCAEPPSADYGLSWSDEFDGTRLSESDWAYRVDKKHRSEQRRENVSVAGGSLHLALTVADDKIQRKFRASGAGVVTRQRFRYGYYEARARLGASGKEGRGWHHSFWAMAAEIDDAGHVETTYPELRRTEIDCFENPTEHRREPLQSGLSRFSQHVIVWGESGREVARLPKPPTDVTRVDDFDATKWHIYGFEWTPNVVRFYVDDQLTKSADYPASRYEHDEVNLWLTAISANWNSGDQTPSAAEYDYLRAYTKESRHE